MMALMVRALIFTAVCLAPMAAQAEIRYTVEPIGDNSRLQVTMRFPAKPGIVELQMPNWAPGAYVLSKPAQGVANLQWTDASGESLLVDQVDSRWRAKVRVAGETVVRYSVPVRFDAGALHYSGPSTYLYVEGRKEEDCRLELKVPSDWKIAVGLNAVGNSKVEFKAPDYDVLADNPVTAGDFVEYRYTSQGKPITIALRGPFRTKIKEAEIVKVCKTVSDYAGNFFKGLPFDKYVWHFSVFPGADGGGGLEHLTSTQISLPDGMGPTSARVLAHEFFHLWNVKRIRSKPLGPFDYTKLPKTGALYWLEGITDYYASLIMLRSGYRDEASLHKDLVDNLTRVRNNPARLEVSPYESGYRVGEANEGRGNSSGWRISYYNLGWLVGLCLDLELRHRTGGRGSLDDVERSLWELCKDGKPGFREEDLYLRYVRFGGSGDFFDRVVMKPGELPVESVLLRVGLRLTQTSQKKLDRGFDITGTTGSAKVKIDELRPPAVAAGLKEDDELLEVNGRVVTGPTMADTFRNVTAAFEGLKIGDPVKLKVRRGTDEIVATYQAGETSTMVYEVVEDPRATAKQKELRRGWYRG